MRKYTPLLLVLLILCFVTVKSAVGQVVNGSSRDFLPEKMLPEVSAAITGKVTNIISFWDPSRQQIYTHITIKLQEVIKGQFSQSEIVLEQPGGQLAHQSAWLIGSPEFSRGEQVFLLLNKDERGVWHTAHLRLGKFTITNTPSSSLDSLKANRLISTDELATLRQHGSTLVPELSTSTASLPTSNRVNIQSLEAFTLAKMRFFEPDTNQPVNFLVNTQNAPISGGGLAEINRAMSAWNQAGSRLRLANAGTTMSCGAVTDGQSTISFGPCPLSMDPPMSDNQGVISTVMVVTGTRSRQFNGVSFMEIVESDIFFNPGFENLLRISTNLEELATTNLGLAFGLNNSSTDPNEPDPTLRESIMYFIPHFDGRGARLNPDDQTGVNTIYPFFEAVKLIDTRLSQPLINVAYSQQLSARDGFPGYTFSVTNGQLPAGLTLTDDGLIAGTPTAVETQNVEITVTDTNGFTASQVFNLVVSALPPRIDRITPARVRYNGDTLIMIQGDNFLGTSNVTISTGTINFRVLDNNTIGAQVIGPNTTGLVADLRVTNPGGVSLFTSAIFFDGPVLQSARIAKVRVRNQKGKVVNNRGIIVQGQALSFLQKVRVNGTTTTLASQRDQITGQIVYFGDNLKSLIPARGDVNITIIDEALNSESNAVVLQRLTP
jgi:hypothetical protein